MGLLLLLSLLERKASNSRVERNRIEYDGTSSFELERVSVLVHDPAAIESA